MKPAHEQVDENEESGGIVNIGRKRDFQEHNFQAYITNFFINFL